MEIASKYSPEEVEGKWYQYWLDNGLFKSKPDGREPYTIVIPPPNVTGVLHMGHMLNNTIQDILVRHARMQGKNACWVPGTDHASIATEAKVVNKLAQEGIKKTDLTRDEFLKHAWAWKEEHGGIILKQLRKLGASCDWDRTAFTMDETRSESVIKVFVDLYNKGLIYRGVRMVNWDPKAKTALSDEEVVYKEEHSKLYYLRYKIEGEAGYAVVATTRPETIMGDTAMCINPNDPKNIHLKGKKVIVPLVNRVIPVIEDEYVDIEFGTGCLKVTPAHDVNDYMLGEKYNLPSIDIFNDDGTISKAGGLYVGMDRFDVREQIEKDLAAAGLLEKVEDYDNKVGFSERTNVPIEPKLSMQWFLKMEHLAKIALDPVMNDDIKFYPTKFKNTYRHWMENIKDWCISRQLWWGHRIPAYYLPNNDFVVAKTKEEALTKAQNKYPELSLQITDLKQDEDVMDTWFSSWLWPISVFDGIRNPNNEDINYYYPTAVLITAPEIIFFWVARMVMAGIEWRQNIPFKDVYFTGIVRDKLRRKMSKSLGNSPDPIELIQKYGADGVRVGMLFSSPAGNDLMFDESLCEQGRNFSNKIWNAFRLIKGWEICSDIEQPQHSATAISWFNQRMNEAVRQINDDFEKYRLSDALMNVYKLIWDDFCSVFLEIVKPPYQQPIDIKSFGEINDLFEKLMRILHPFMPFITEELWHGISDRGQKESIMLTQMPTFHEEPNSAFLTQFGDCLKVVESIRRIRAEKNIPQKIQIELYIQGNPNTNGDEASLNAVMMKLCNIATIQYVSEKVPGTISFIEQNTEYYIPLGDTINVEEEIAKLQNELKYTEGFLNSVMKKLSNEKFVAGAPDQVVAMEKKKMADAEEKIVILKEQITNLQK